MNKTMTWLVGVAMALLSLTAFGNAKVHSMTGTVSSAVGAAPAQAVKAGDTIPAGQTVITAANSTVVLQFPDGQLAALTPNTRMTIEQYQFNEKAKTGNISLNLLGGGMRAVTGLIGRSAPDKVAYKAGTATIGIRGTDVTFTYTANNQTVTVVVSAGQVSFQIGNAAPVVVPAGRGLTTTVPAVGATGAAAATATITVTDIAAVLTAVGGPNSALGQVVNALLSPSTTQGLVSASSAGTATVAPTAGTATTTGQTTTITVPPPPKSQ